MQISFEKLNEEMQMFTAGETERSYAEHQFSYENEYIDCRCYNSSNKWVDRPRDVMSKSWSIIFDFKKGFEHLPNYKLLSRKYAVGVTRVNSGKNKGCYGLRIYGMKKKPAERIVRIILDFIFE